MKVVRERMTKDEIARRLQGLFESRLKGLGMPRRERTEMAVQLVRFHAAKLHALAVARRIKKVYDAAKKRKPVRERKSDAVCSRSLGVSRKRCPDCDARLRIWPEPFGGTHLSCGRCGWSSREPTKDGAYER